MGLAAIYKHGKNTFLGAEKSQFCPNFWACSSLAYNAVQLKCISGKAYVLYQNIEYATFNNVMRVFQTVFGSN